MVSPEGIPFLFFFIFADTEAKTHLQFIFGVGFSSLLSLSNASVGTRPRLRIPIRIQSIDAAAAPTLVPFVVAVASTPVRSTYW
jgi:hypothetical protein